MVNELSELILPLDKLLGTGELFKLGLLSHGAAGLAKLWLLGCLLLPMLELNSFSAGVLSLLSLPICSSGESG